MPEGDIAWRVGRRLHAALGGRVLTESDLRWPSLATVDLRGRDVVEATSRGKHILVRIAAGGSDPPVTVHSHLRMEGSWHVHRTGESWSRDRSGSGVRAVLAHDTRTARGHKLGMLDRVPTSAEAALVGHIAVVVLRPDWSVDEALRRLRAQPDRAV